MQGKLKKCPGDHRSQEFDRLDEFETAVFEQLLPLEDVASLGATMTCISVYVRHVSVPLRVTLYRLAELRSRLLTPVHGLTTGSSTAFWLKLSGHAGTTAHREDADGARSMRCLPGDDGRNGVFCANQITHCEDMMQLEDESFFLHG